MNTLDLGTITPAPAAPQTPKSVDITVSNFTAEIIEGSNSHLIIALFWSPQSAASAQLTSHLEKVIAGTDGAVRLAKIDISKNQQIAQQMHVQQIPAVYAFWQGQPVDGFMGAIPEAQLKGWLTKLIQTTGAKGGADNKKGIERAIAQAEHLLEQGDIKTAQSIYEDLSSEFPEEPPVIAGCIKCMVKSGALEDAKGLLSNLPDKLKLDNEVQSAAAVLELAEQASSNITEEDADTWLSELEVHPDNHETRFDYAMHLYASGHTQESLSQLLEIVSRERNWEDEKARKQILKIFEALGPMHEHTVEARRKLGTIIFS